MPYAALRPYDFIVYLLKKLKCEFPGSTPPGPAEETARQLGEAEDWRTGTGGPVETQQWDVRPELLGQAQMELHSHWSDQESYCPLIGLSGIRIGSEGLDLCHKEPAKGKKCP